VTSTQQVDKIAGDIQGVIRVYKQLYAHTSSFINFFNGGTEELRICIKGLVTTTFKGNSYQTPIIIWISSRYPQAPPEFYVDVSAAPGMVVAHNHACVKPEGEVGRSAPLYYHRYLFTDCYRAHRLCIPTWRCGPPPINTASGEVPCP
jgi:hypothetical protein